MKQTDANEVIDIIKSSVKTLDAVVRRNDDLAAANYRRLSGDMSANVETYLRSLVLAQKLSLMFDAAWESGFDFGGVTRYIASVRAFNPSGVFAKIYTTSLERFGLMAFARTITSVSMRSRYDVEKYIKLTNLLFEPAEDYAADHAQSIYRMMIETHARIVRDLNNRGRSLPIIIEYKFNTSFPSLVLSNYFYGTADRSEEIKEENKVPQPLFMPNVGRILAR